MRPPEIHQRGNGLRHRPNQPCHRRRDGVRLALTLLTALGEPEKNREALEVLSAKAEKVKKHQAEAKAHVKNVRKGKKKQ